MPKIPETVARVSAGAVRDDAIEWAYYEAVVTIDEAGLAERDDFTLVPGMPVQVLLRTEERTPIAFLAQPLAIYLKRAFRE